MKDYITNVQMWTNKNKNILFLKMSNWVKTLRPASLWVCVTKKEDASVYASLD